MSSKDILVIENLADFEKKINRDSRPYDINMMVMPGTLEDKHKDVDPQKGIQALRRKFNLIYIFVEGIHDVYLGADYRWLKPNDLVIVPENMVYASKNVNNCTGYCMHFMTSFIQPLLHKTLEEEFPFFDLEAEHIINVTPEESELIQQSFRDIIREYDRFSPEKDYLLRNFIQILLLRVREIYRPHAKRINETASHATRVTNQFKHLLQKHFIEIRRVEQYAEMMHITPKHLCDLVKEATGKTPKQIMIDVLLLEAKVMLGSTRHSMTEISHRLRFQDQAHFSHFVRQHTGYSPMRLRKKL
jgi:AraC-like DNA-binding protein/mannose-6-phosphate isomerase-like protein (cupin superfamily)